MQLSLTPYKDVRSDSLSENDKLLWNRGPICRDLLFPQVSEISTKINGTPYGGRRAYLAGRRPSNKSRPSEATEDELAF